jgi:hypothetical protein
VELRMPDKKKGYYAIQKDKDDLSSAITVCHATGRSEAEKVVDRLNRELTEEERSAGWFHFLQKTTEKAPSVKKVSSGKKKVKGRTRVRWSGR